MNVKAEINKWFNISNRERLVEKRLSELESKLCDEQKKISMLEDKVNSNCQEARYLGIAQRYNATRINKVEKLVTEIKERINTHFDINCREMECICGDPKSETDSLTGKCCSRYPNCYHALQNSVPKPKPAPEIPKCDKCGCDMKLQMDGSWFCTCDDLKREPMRYLENENHCGWNIEKFFSQYNKFLTI